MFLLTLTKALKGRKVRYALVGGYAVSLHGAVRGTLDIDIVLPFEEGQLKKAEAALFSLGLKSRLPISAEDVFRFRKEYIEKRNLVAWSFVNANNPSELVDILITEDLNELETIRVKIDRSFVEVVSIPDLITMKRKAGREQDLADIKALEMLK